MRNVVLGASAMLAALAAFGGSDTAVGAVEYVKICSVYGEGWYYQPGSDICIKARTGETRQQTELGTVYGQTDMADRISDTESAVADMQRRFDAAFQDQSDQSAIAAALADPDLVAGEHFGVKFNWGTLTGGVATTGRNTGGRAGVQFSW